MILLALAASALAMQGTAPLAQGIAVDRDIHVPKDHATIQSAIDAARPGERIIVASGVYRESLVLADGVRLRSADGAASTIIEGAGSGALIASLGLVSRSTLVRGFTFRPAAPGSGPAFDLLLTSSLTISDCVFEGAFGSTNAPVTIACSWYSAPLVQRCLFDGQNEASSFGAAWTFYASQATFSNCLFIRHAGPSVITIADGSVALLNSTVVDNQAVAVEANHGRALIFNSILHNPSAVTELTTLGTGLDVRYSNVRGGFAGSGNIDALPTFQNPVAGDYRLVRGSPGIDAASNSLTTTLPFRPWPGPPVYDLGGGPRFLDDPTAPDTGEGDGPLADMGAFETP